MFPGLNPKKMNALMKQMGIQQVEIDANRVIIECDDKNIVINNPSVVKINMQGQENFQISGDISEQAAEQPTEQEESEEENKEDIKTIMEKTNCTEEQAKEALEKNNNNLADAILSLS
jgi:nascent polypeptide-associated complex subunit alpha